VLRVVLYQPEIPPNTGNVIRLCANTGAQLHLVEPLGFELEDARLRRAGLDYHEFANVTRHPNLEDFIARFPAAVLHAFSTRATTRFTEVAYGEDVALLFGPETRGLPDAVLQSVPPERRLRLPMVPGNRSVNLSNAVAVAVYEVWRQREFKGGK